MKTTVDLPDELVIAAKKRAAEERSSLRDLVAKGLRRELSAAARRSPPRTMEWPVVEGGLPPGLDVNRRAAMYEWLDDQNQ